MKGFVLVLIAAVFSTMAFSQKSVKESCAIATPPEIDAKLEDWTTDWSLDPDGKFLYNICNDADNLYVRIKVTDITTQQKIGFFGFTLWLDPSGKKKPRLGLKYPMGVHNKQDTELPALPANAKRGELEKNLLRDVEVLEFIGLADDPIVSSRVGLMNGLQVLIAATNDGAYEYEAKIPFKAFRIKKSEVEALGVGLETGRLEQQTRNQSPNTGASPNSLSARNSGMNMGYYQQAFYGSGPQSEMMKNTKLWVLIKLN
jgi:hypothetical protein